VQFDELIIRELLTSIAAKTPTPGGGAVASITAALSASLAQMVVNYSIGKKSLAGHAELHQAALHTLQEQATTAMALAQDDARAYSRLNELLKLDKSNARRQREFPAAVQASIDAPRAVLQRALEMLKLLQTLSTTINPMLKSDLAIAAVLAEAAVRAAAWNIRVNLPLLDDAAKQADLNALLSKSLAQAMKQTAAIEQACQ